MRAEFWKYQNCVDEGLVNAWESMPLVTGDWIATIHRSWRGSASLTKAWRRPGAERSSGGLRARPLPKDGRESGLERSSASVLGLSAGAPRNRGCRV